MRGRATAVVIGVLWGCAAAADEETDCASATPDLAADVAKIEAACLARCVGAPTVQCDACREAALRLAEVHHTARSQVETTRCEQATARVAADRRHRELAFVVLTLAGLASMALSVFILVRFRPAPSDAARTDSNKVVEALDNLYARGSLGAPNLDLKLALVEFDRWRDAWAAHVRRERNTRDDADEFMSGLLFLAGCLLLVAGTVTALGPW